MSKTAKTLGITLLATGLAGCVILALSAPVSQAAGIVVNSLADGWNSGDSLCTLREAIQNANDDAQTSVDCAAGTGNDTIGFDVWGVITIVSGTLTIDDDDPTTINGDRHNDGDPDIEVRYSAGTINDGLVRIQTSNNHIEGLAITNSSGAGLYIDGFGDESDDNLIEDCWIGIDLTGAARGNTKYGVYIRHVAAPGSGATDNVLQNNTLSANGWSGLRIDAAPGTQVLSNTVGLNPAGTAARSNGSSGISLSADSNTTIQGNTVSGNTGHGIYLTRTQEVTITNNIVGLNAAGNAPVANQSTGGIYMETEVVTATIRGNTISGNSENGIYLGSGTTNVVIAGNRIGTDIGGTTGLGNGRTINGDGVQLKDAYGNTIGGPTDTDRNIIAHNGRAGVFIAGELADNNTVQNNYIGTDVTGSQDLGNGDGGSSMDQGDGGVYVYDGADQNVIRDNLIRYNYVGVRFSGGRTTLVTPPQSNEVLTNTITNNDKYGIVNQTTHRNTAPYTTPAGGDNLIQNNTIEDTAVGCGPSWCTGIGIFNYGASPNIVNNTISDNESFGIANRVYFGTDGPANASDDLLSMPYISANTISSNEDDGIQSRDTAPENKDTLLDDNTFVNNHGEPHISQRWFVGIEVISGTETLTTGLVVTITAQSGAQACPNGDCVGSTFASAGGSDGIWGPSTVSYTNVENESDGTTTWFEVIESEVDWQGNPMTYTSHLVQVGGDEKGSRYFDFDGITTTQEINGEVNLPFCRATGILSDSDHSLCRYQIGQVEVFDSSSDGDWDDDGIPDDTEGTGDTDGDGTPDYQDTDSDGDGIPDSVEGADDTDGDGTPDFQDTDSDDDGIPDSVEGTDDTDSDGTPDYKDTDSDGDGIPDEDEAECSPGKGTGDPCDSDGDGTPDYKDMDSDNDGVADNAEGSGDTDGDGVPNYRDTDSDGDGEPDKDDPDDDNDGIPDTEEGLVDNEGVDNDSSVDTDGDGLPDYLDEDSDNDGVPDWVEAGCDAEPTDNSTVCPNPNQDSDGDGIVDRLDDDADNDGTIDGEEWYDGEAGDEFCSDTTVDSDGDGIPNCQDNDVDGDGIPNYLDDDSDGDGTPDEDESRTDPDPSPLNNGIPAWLDPIYHVRTPLLFRDF